MYNNCNSVELKEMTFEKNNNELLDKDEENIDNENVDKNPLTGEGGLLIIFIAVFSLVIIYKYLKKCNS